MGFVEMRQSTQKGCLHLTEAAPLKISYKYLQIESPKDAKNLSNETGVYIL